MCCSASCTKTVSLVSLYVHWLTQFLMTLFFCQQWHGPEGTTPFSSVTPLFRRFIDILFRCTNGEKNTIVPQTRNLLISESELNFLKMNHTIKFCFHQKLYWPFENFCGRCGGNKCFEMDIDCFVLDQNLISLREKASCPWSLSYDDKPQINSFSFALTVSVKVRRSDDIYC